jgi:type I restriction enzyme S subunit
MYGLKTQTIQGIQEVFKQYPEVEKAILYGSRAKGNYHPGSDIDLTLIGEQLNLTILQKIENEIDELLLPYKIDLSLHKQIQNAELLEHIKRVGKVFFDKNERVQTENPVQDSRRMSEWKEYKLGELTEVVTKGTTPTTIGGGFISEGINFIKSEAVGHDGRIDKSTFVFISEETHQKLRRSQLQVDDILFSMAGIFLGKNAIVTKDLLPANTNQALAIIRLNKNKALPKYISYYLRQRTVVELVNNMSGQSAQPNINFEEIKSIDVTLPPLPEQAAIAEVLSSLDDKIDLLHRQNKTLEQLAETLFSEKLKVNSEKWEEKPLSSLIIRTLGGEWGKEELEGEFTKQVCCLRGTDIADLQSGLAERVPIRFIKEKKFESISPKDGDLILEISGGTDDQSTGRTIYINELNRSLFPYPPIFSNFCRLLRPIRKEYSYFLYLYIQYLYKKDEFFNLENGSSGIKNLDYKYLLNDLKFLLPNNESEILEFDMEVRLYFEKINKNKHQIRTLTQLRDTLLPKLMSGEIRLNYDLND